MTSLAYFCVAALILRLDITSAASSAGVKIHKYDNGASFSVFANGRRILRHEPRFPMVTVANGHTTFTEKLGNFVVKNTYTDKQDMGIVTIKYTQNGDILIRLSNSSVVDNNQVNVTIHFINQSITDITMKIDSPFFKYIWYRLNADPNEYIYGAGVQYSYLNLRGHKFPLWTREQGVGRNKSTWVTQLMDLYDGGGGDYYTTYYPQPTFFSSKNYSCNLNTSKYATFNFKHPYWHEMTITNDGEPVNLSIHQGPSLKEAVTNFTKGVGCQPMLPEWAMNGTIIGIQGGTDVVVGNVTLAREYNVDVSGVWIQDWVGIDVTNFGERLFWNWEWNKKRYPDLDRLISQYRSEGIRVLTYINPHFNQNGSQFKEADKLGYLVKNLTNGGTYIQDFGEFYCGTIDLTNPAAATWYKESIIKTNLINLGISGWMADFGEYLPADGIKYHSGADPREMHNLYPTLWAKLNREAIEEAGKLNDVVFWTRSGFSGTSAYSTLHWAGDQNVDFSLADGVASTIPAALSAGMSGMGLTHFDIGGYTSVFTIVRSEEMLLRSAEMAAFTPFFRTHEGNMPQKNWQIYSKNSTMAKFAWPAKIHSMLYNYTKSLVQEASTEGTPVMRPLFFHYPGDPVTYELKYQYMYGSDVVVAPVYSEGAEDWQIYLPEGRWNYFWNATMIVTGPRHVTIDSPLGKIPAFYRANSKWAAHFKHFHIEFVQQKF